ncbi:hypothetical protein C1646_777064 [Rhizophagus diaphanus]|nr:hypothetical protein C1646_777064 [Rhizophagus diaphanus] [Rhizophagus sp. MUCL 43196]
MSTKTSVSKTQQPKNNNYTAILDQHLEKYNLSAKSTPEQLSEHAPEFNASLSDWMARRCVKVPLAKSIKKRSAFSKEQIEAFVPNKRKEKLTIEERAKYCAKTSDKWDIFIYSRDIGPKSKDNKEIITGCSQLSLFRNELQKAGIAQELIDTYAKDPNVTTSSNKIQKEQTDQNLAKNWLRTPKYFSIASVSKRLRDIDITKDLSMQDLADMMVMLSMRPAEVSNLQINHYEVDLSNRPAWYENGYSWYYTGYKKNKDEYKDNPELRPFISMEKDLEQAIKAEKLGNPTFSKNGKRNTQVLSNFLKPHKIMPKILRKIGGKNYAIGDIESEDSGPKDKYNSKPESESTENDKISDIINMYSY